MKKHKPAQDGFITMIVMIVLILIAIIGFAYFRVAGASK
jgi:Tfp pilus assembly protein PilX